ncbi:MAG: sulfite exporter TauE/SafE family protein [Caldimonas sp.]
MPLFPPVAIAVLVAGVGIVFLAGIVRGFAGFGFSAVSVAGLSLLVAPASVVPAIFILEVLASVTLLKSALPHVDWRWLGWLVLGNALFSPLGILVLASVPETPLRLVIGALLLAAAALQRRGRSFDLEPTRAVRFAVGSIAGLANGIAAIGGIAVAVLLGTSRLPPVALRATLIVLFLVTDLYALAWSALVPAGAHGTSPLLGPATLAWALWLTPAMLAGIAVGGRFFAGTSPTTFRRRVLDLLIVVAALSVTRALIDLAA